MSSKPPKAPTIRSAQSAELESVAAMNKALIDEEGARNPMTTAELQDRLARFLIEGWQIDIIVSDDKLAGYALHRYEPNDAEPSGRYVHLRHFFIAPEYRKKGLGRTSLKLLSKTRWQPGDRIQIDVLTTNPGGRAFWQQIGFNPYSEAMELRV